MSEVRKNCSKLRGNNNLPSRPKLANKPLASSNTVTDSGRPGLKTNYVKKQGVKQSSQCTSVRCCPETRVLPDVQQLNSKQTNDKQNVAQTKTCDCASKERHDSHKFPTEVPDSTSSSFLRAKEKQLTEKVSDECSCHCIDKSKTWFDVLSEEQNSGSTQCCARNNEQPAKSNLLGSVKSALKQCVCVHSESKAEKCNSRPSSQLHLLNKLVAGLYNRLKNSEEEETLILILSAKKVLRTLINGDAGCPYFGNCMPDSVKNQDKNSCTSSSCEKNVSPTDKNKQTTASLEEKYTKLLRLLEENGSVSRTENGAILSEMRNDLQSVSEKTDEYGKNVLNIKDLLVNMRRENKMIGEMKEIRETLESKMSAVILENNNLKNEIHNLMAEHNRCKAELRRKSEEVKQLKEQILKIGSLFGEDCEESILKGSDQPASAIPMPVSSSPLMHSSFFVNLEPRNSEKAGSVKSDNDSGIQSNTPGLTVPSTVEKMSFKSNVEKIIANLKDSLRIQDDDLQEYLNIGESSICLSDTTYRYSIPSLSPE